MPGPPSKRKDVRQNRINRPELGVVPADEAAVIVPEPPATLLKVAQERWVAYWRSPVSQAVDVGADWGRLERWIRAVDEWHRVGKEFRKARTVDGSMGQPVLNPLGPYLS